MKPLTNQSIWLAGAFDHMRHPVRELDVPLQVSWFGITARACQILADRDRLIVIVSAASAVSPSPSDHDYRNAEITALAYSKQDFARQFSSVRAYLRDEQSRQFEVDIDTTRIERQIRKRALEGRQPDRALGTIPSPLASFLLRQFEKFRF